MRRSNIIVVIVLAVLGVGGYIFLNNPAGSDAAIVSALGRECWESIQFKRYRKASLSPHKLERDRVDIGKAIEKLMLIKAEQLEIKRFDVVKAKVDSDGDGASTKLRVIYRRPNQKKEPEEKDVMLYWLRRHPDCPIGATCNAEGACVNEAHEVLRQVKPSKGVWRIATPDDEGKEELEATKKGFACDPAAKKAWFMNLDSTLQPKGGKRYNY